MPKKPTKEKVKNVDNVPEPVDENPAPEEPTEEDALDIINGEKYIRQYSKKVHGDNFAELAAQFCAKKPKKGSYTAVPASTITKLEVRFREKSDADKSIDNKDPKAVMEDKTVVFTDKDAAVRFGITKFASTVVVSKRK